MSTYLSTFILTLSTIFIFYIYIKIVSYKYWKRKNVPYISPSFPFGNVSRLVFQKTSIGLYFQDIYTTLKKQKAQYGGLYIYTTPIFVPTSPNLINNILGKDFKHFHDRPFLLDKSYDPLSNNLVFLRGQEWRILRKKVSPVFTTEKIKKIVDLIVDSCKDIEWTLNDAVNKNKAIDLKDFFLKITMGISGRYVYGLNRCDIKNIGYGFENHCQSFLKRSILKNNSILLGLIIPKLMYIFKISTVNKTTSNFFINVFNEVIEKRQNNPIEHNDILEFFIQQLNDSTFSVEQMAAQAFNFFFASSDSSTTILTFCMLELILNKHVYVKVMNEIQTEMNNKEYEITFEGINRMKYLDMVIYETARKYPTSPTILRKCTQDYYLAETKSVIKAGTIVCLPILGIQHDPEYFPDPETFDPERFTIENIATRPSGTFLSFGYGPRVCIGHRLAMVQMKIILVTILRKYYFSPAFDSKYFAKEIDTKGLFLRPKNKIKMFPINKTCI